jgi:hypothetical protein
VTRREGEDEARYERLVAENEALRDLANFVIRLHRQQKDPLRAVKPAIALRAAAQKAERILVDSELDDAGMSGLGHVE